MKIQWKEANTKVTDTGNSCLGKVSEREREREEAVWSSEASMRQFVVWLTHGRTHQTSGHVLNWLQRLLILKTNGEKKNPVGSLQGGTEDFKLSNHRGRIRLARCQVGTYKNGKATWLLLSKLFPSEQKAKKWKSEHVQMCPTYTLCYVLLLLLS